MSPFRGALYFVAQIGGAIAGSALLYGVTTSGSQGSLGVTVIASGLRDWQGFAIEFSFTFIIVLSYLGSLHPEQKRTVSTSMGSGSIMVGFSYLACSLVALPSTGASFNPVRSLGPAFVMNKWDSHWIYWIGPLLGGAFGGLIHEFVFNTYQDGCQRKSTGEGDSSSVHSDEECYEEADHGSTPLRGPVPGALTARNQHYEAYKPMTVAQDNLCKSSRNLDQSESIYAGTRSLYCRSPIAAQRTMLNRSQSVYSKSQNLVNQRIHPVASAVAPKNGGFEALSRQENIYVGRLGAPSMRSESIYVPRSQFQNEAVYYSKKQNENVYSTKPPLASDPYPRSDSGYSQKADQLYQPPLPPTPMSEDQKLEEENIRNAECTRAEYTRSSNDPYNRNENEYGRRQLPQRHESVCGVVPPIRRDESYKQFSPNNSHSDSAYGSVNTPSTPSGNKGFNYSLSENQNKNYQQTEQLRGNEYNCNQGALIVDATRESLYGYSKQEMLQNRQNSTDNHNVQAVRY
ncbi:hypothetical protein QYM36_000532 [Artemia franciscana]|nr:hypothetical protein QYM36_000532 [Artemia franciscana]